MAEMTQQCIRRRGRMKASVKLPTRVGLLAHGGVTGAVS